MVSLIPLTVKAIPYEAWNNYKVLNFNDGFEGLQVNFNVTYGYGDNGLNFNCKENFEDLRFFNYDDDVLLYAWNKTTINSNYCEIWLKLGTSKNVTMRYNNPNAEAYWDIDAVFIDVIDNVELALPLDEGSGDTTEDFSGNGNNGILVNSPIWVDGKYNKALSFDGANTYVKILHSPSLDCSSAITLSLYIFPNGHQASYHRLIDKEYSTAFALNVMNNDKLNLAIDIGGVNQEFNSVGTFDINMWNHIDVVYDGSHVIFYINGVPDEQVPSPLGNIGTNMYNLFISKYFAGNGFAFNGIIDDVRIYNRALSETEIENIYENYSDATIIEGSICCRIWVDIMPSIVFGVEYSIPTNDIMLIAIFALIVGFCALLLVITKKERK